MRWKTKLREHAANFRSKDVRQRLRLEQRRVKQYRNYARRRDAEESSSREENAAGVAESMGRADGSTVVAATATRGKGKADPFRAEREQADKAEEERRRECKWNLSVATVFVSV